MSTTEVAPEPSTAVAVVEPHQPARQRFDQEQIALIARTIAPGCSNDELALFVKVAERTGLDPFAKQIHALKRKVKNPDTDRWEERLSIQVGIDGFRLIAERTGQYEGRLGPYWCGEDGEWGINQDGKPKPWLNASPPAAALVGIHKRGWREPLWAVARYTSYVQTVRDGGPNKMWATMPDGQLGKCAEALALRGAFPAELSGIYTEDEMGQAHNPTPADQVDPYSAAGWAHPEAHDEHRRLSNEMVRALPEDARKQMQEWVNANTEGFRTVWTPEQAAGYRGEATRLTHPAAESPQEAKSAPEGTETPDTPVASAPAPEGGAGEPLPAYMLAIIEEVKAMENIAVLGELDEAGLDCEGDDATVRARLVEHRVANAPDTKPF